MFGFFKEKIEDFKQTVSNTAKSLVGNVLANVDETEEEYYRKMNEIKEKYKANEIGSVLIKIP